MSEKAIFGAIIMAILVLISLFGEIETGESRAHYILVIAIIVPLLLVFTGFIMGYIKDALLEFFESVPGLLKKGRAKIRKLKLKQLF